MLQKPSRIWPKEFRIRSVNDSCRDIDIDVAVLWHLTDTGCKIKAGLKIKDADVWLMLPMLRRKTTNVSSSSRPVKQKFRR